MKNKYKTTKWLDINLGSSNNCSMSGRIELFINYLMELSEMYDQVMDDFWFADCKANNE